jgi:hypothetical protein
MKNILSVILLVLGFLLSKAQTFEDRFFNCIGWGFDFGRGPGQVYSPVYSSDHYDTACFAYQNSYVGVSICFEARYNIVEPSVNSAVSIKSRPTLDVLFGSGLLGVFVPLGVGLELGNGSTYKAESNTGFTFSAGYVFNFNPLLKIEDIFETAKLYQVDLKTNWGTPFVAAGYRYWSASNKLREINILYGFGSANDALPSNAPQLGIESNLDNGKDFKDSYMLCISWMIYMNY